MAITRGFGSMTPAQRRAVSSKGGKNAHALGVANRFTSETAREAGRKGWQAIADRSGHMAAIGAKGGRIAAHDPEHMRAIASKGGRASAAARARARQRANEEGGGS